MKKLKFFVGMLTIFGLFGCAANSITMNKPVTKSELSKLLSESPQIKKLSEKSYEPRTFAENISVYYYAFNPLNSPELVPNWRFHYIVKPATSPEWSYEKVAELTIYIPRRDDKEAHKQYRQLASELGGDAVIDIYRKPIMNEPFPAPVAAYLYNGVVVRKK